MLGRSHTMTTRLGSLLRMARLGIVEDGGDEHVAVQGGARAVLTRLRYSLPQQER